MNPASGTGLSEMQALLADWIRSPRALGNQPEACRAAASHLTGNDRLLPVEQLDIYRQQFWLRHTSSLVEDFPGLGGILGQGEWQRLVEGYLCAHPPEGWTLRDLGRHLPDYVAREGDLPHRALCTDMARLEWHFIELFDAPEAPPLDSTKLAALAPEAIQKGRVVLHPALALLSVQYPVATLRRQLIERAAAAGSGGASEPLAIPEPAPAQLVLYRGQDRGLYHRPVPPEAFALLEGMQRGLCLVAACEHALAQAPEGAESLQRHVGHWFSRWAQRGWIVDVVPAPS